MPGSRRARRERRESGTVGIALAAILLVTALVIAAWRFGGHDDPQVEGVNTKPRTTAVGSSAARQQVTLTVRATRGSSFMEVRAGSRAGSPLYTGTLERGQLQRFTKKTLFLSLSRPANVVVTLDGKRVILPRNCALRITYRLAHCV